MAGSALSSKVPSGAVLASITHSETNNHQSPYSNSYNNHHYQQPTSDIITTTVTNNATTVSSFSDDSTTQDSAAMACFSQSYINPVPPSYAARRPIRVALTSPSRKASVYDAVGKSLTRDDMRKPRLLHSVVHEEEMKSIISRLTRPTVSTRMRAVNFRPESQYTFVDMGRYHWNRMAVYSDYQHQLYTGLGAIQPGFKRTVKTYRPIYC